MKLSQFSFVLIIALLFSPLISSAGDSPKLSRKVTVEISVATTHNGISQLNRKLQNSFKNALVAKGFSVSDDGEFRFFLDGRKVESDNKDRVAISAFAQHILPEKFMQLCADDEIFYKMQGIQDPKKLPEKGKFVRDYVTTEALKQYGMLVFHDLSLINENDLDAACSGLVDRFIKRNNNVFFKFSK